MEKVEEIEVYLLHRQAVLREIAVELERESRFIAKGEIVGLKRVGKKQQQLFKALADVTAELSKAASGWQRSEQLRALEAENRRVLQAVITRSIEVRQQAVEERSTAAARLRRGRLQRQVNTKYARPFINIVSGSKINERR